MQTYCYKSYYLLIQIFHHLGDQDLLSRIHTLHLSRGFLPSIHILYRKEVMIEKLWYLRLKQCIRHFLTLRNVFKIKATKYRNLFLMVLSLFVYPVTAVHQEIKSLLTKMILHVTTLCRLCRTVKKLDQNVSLFVNHYVLPLNCYSFI